MRLVAILLVALVAPSCSFEIVGRRCAGGRAVCQAWPQRRSVKLPLEAQCLVAARLRAAPLRLQAEPPLDPPLPPRTIRPEFRWRVVLFFAANPLIFLPFAFLASRILHLPWLGTSFCLNGASMLQGALYAAPVLLLTSSPVEKVFPALADVNEASQTISLYAMGWRFQPLRALAASIIISSSAAISEELAFRGVLQTLLERLAALTPVPTGAGVVAATLLQAMVFGKLHSYTNSRAYFITATLAGLVFGAAFAATRNVAVPIVMHFVIDLVSFLVCHYQVATADEKVHTRLLDGTSPIAAALRGMTAPPPAAGSPLNGP